MKEKDLIDLERELKDLPARVELIVHARENDDLSIALEEFVRTVCDAAGGRITVRREDGDRRLPALPAFTLSCEKRDNIHYLTVPEERELPPFLKALQYVSRGEAPVSSEAREMLGEISRPAEIWVLVSAFCTNCPKVVESVVGLASMNPQLSANIFDVQYHTKLAEEYGVKSVPATIIDRELVLIGQVTEQRLVRLLARRGTEEFERELLRSLIDRGRAADAARRVCKGKGREALLALFQEQELSTRMGVLVVLEEALEEEPDAVRQMVPSLISLLAHEDARIRGDIADFLGKVGDERAVPHLERLCSDPDPDVAEAASDALDELRGLQQS